MPSSVLHHPSQPKHPTIPPHSHPLVHPISQEDRAAQCGETPPQVEIAAAGRGANSNFYKPPPPNAFWQIFQLSFIMNSRRCFLLHFLIEKWCILWRFPWFSFYCPTCTEQMKWGQAGMSHCRWGRRGLGKGNWDQIEPRMAEQGCEDEDKIKPSWDGRSVSRVQGECPDMDRAAIHLQGLWGCGQAWALQHQISSKRKKKIILKSNR